MQDGSDRVTTFIIITCTRQLTEESPSQIFDWELGGLFSKWEALHLYILLLYSPVYIDERGARRNGLLDVCAGQINAALERERSSVDELEFTEFF